MIWTNSNGITIGKVESIGNPAGIGQGTGFRLRERDRDGIGLGHYRLRANYEKQQIYISFAIDFNIFSKSFLGGREC